MFFLSISSFFFFFNDTATTEIYTLSLHDALPISQRRGERCGHRGDQQAAHEVLSTPATGALTRGVSAPDRKSTRLNSSHLVISYAVFCLKKKKKHYKCKVNYRRMTR